ncbi:hypothetical protein A3SI_06934 [Nitritalea halalkaliphila LW7]|uniref:Uncharacterized protein n=1 Tax=Nitritalea halalkaliphila LW7 TaxID=1189621 RepID=I5C5D9_9BACT|nr:hypothetical protein [Nitritalea halalkaliphila]EIM77041.1 hypothetical protein A3SI_06934 [Nitritalea halalkaliphila LW7]
MKQNKATHTVTWKQRLSLLLAVFFCFLFSSGEFLYEQLRQHADVHLEQSAASADAERESVPGESFLAAPVQAVLPFISLIAEQMLYFIYEILPPLQPKGEWTLRLIPLSGDFNTILFERIISKNAP